MLQSIDVLKGKAETISSTSLAVGAISAAFFRLYRSFVDDFIFKAAFFKKIFAYYACGLGVIILMLQFAGIF
ncbi:hypothetical protein GCM10020331_062890 [Ectobacillus funiculus]